MNKSNKAKTPPAPQSNTAQLAVPTSEEIAACAYSIWEREDRPEGREVEHWLAAEIRLRQDRCQSEPQK